MIDIFDIMAFVVFAVLIAAGFVIVVGLGMLPGRIAQKRGHPQAAAINVASWLGLATGGVLWLLALIWAFLRPAADPSAAGSHPAGPNRTADANAQLAQMQARVAALEATFHALKDKQEGGS
jgi:hypothetical protein